jgi:TonB family protein
MRRVSASLGALMPLALVLPLGLGTAPLWAAEAEEARDAAMQIYSLRLVQTGAKLEAYPEEAVRDGLEGSAVVSIQIDERGQLVRREVVRSSGHRLLDAHAVSMLEQAVPRTPLPLPLQNTAFRLLVTVSFVIPPRFRIPSPPTSRWHPLRGAPA